jgi:hypothetical protein
MTIKINATEKANEFEIVQVLGRIRYDANREFPWLGEHQWSQYFETREQALHFAKTGEVLK